MASDDALFSVMMDDRGISLTTNPPDFYQDVVACSNAEYAVFTDVVAAEDQIILEQKEDNALENKQNLVTLENMVAVENQETAAVDEMDAPENTEGAVQVDKAEVPGKNQEAAISVDVSDLEINTLEAIADNQKTATRNEVDALETTEETGQADEVKAAARNQEAAKSEDVNDTDKNILEAVTWREKLETISNNLEVVAANPAMDIIYQPDDAVSTELVKSKVGKQLEEIKGMVEDVLNRLNAIEALLH